MVRGKVPPSKYYWVTYAAKGKIMIDGKHCNKPLKNIVKIGYIPETPSLYEELTLKEHIEVTALAYDIPLEEAFKRAEPLLKRSV